MTDCFIWEYSIKLKAWGLKAHRAGSNAQTLAVLLHPLYVLHHFPLSKPPYILANMLGLSRAAKMGAVAAGAKGLRGFIIIGFRHLTTGNALKCILSQSKGNNQQNFCSQVASFCSFVPGPPQDQVYSADRRDFGNLQKSDPCLLQLFMGLVNSAITNQ